MPRGSAYKRAMSTLGTSVLAVFLFGLTSAPLRPCFSHPGHDSGHANELAQEPIASHHGATTTEHAPASEHEGCSCLSQCSLEHAPHLPGADLPALAYSPIAPKALIAASGRTHTPHDQFGVPLARPPPAVV